MLKQQNGLWFFLFLLDPNVDIRSLEIQVNTVATVLKAFFKDTEPLIPSSLQEELLEAAGMFYKIVISVYCQCVTELLLENHEYAVILHNCNSKK